MRNKFKQLEINIGDIWRYEYNFFKQKNESKYYDHVCEIIRENAVNHIKPFISATDDVQQEVYEKYENAYNKKSNDKTLDFFESNGDFYDYGEDYVVNPNNEPAKGSKKLYTLLFGVKLRQYENNLTELDDFLYYQCLKNFNRNISEFDKFFSRMLIQNKNIFKESIKEYYDLWFKEYDETQYKKFDLDYLKFQKFIESQETIPLIISNEKVKEYWSFLYLEKNDVGTRFINKDDFDRFFGNGLKVPVEPLPKNLKVTLNFTPKYKRSIVEIAMYKFFSLYAKNQKDKLPFLKFLAYNFTNFDTYKTEKDLVNWGKNLVESKMNAEKLFFDLNVYINKVKVD